MSISFITSVACGAFNMSYLITQHVLLNYLWARYQQSLFSPFIIAGRQQLKADWLRVGMFVSILGALLNIHDHHDIDYLFIHHGTQFYIFTEEYSIPSAFNFKDPLKL